MRGFERIPALPNGSGRCKEAAFPARLMTPEIILTLLVIGLTLVAFIREWAAPDVIALTVLCLVVAMGLVPMLGIEPKLPGEKYIPGMTDVFKNEAPLAIAALFIIGGALEASGAVDHIGRVLRDRLPSNTRWAVLGFSLLTCFFSAWMNNTAIVAILLPVALGFARSKEIAPSRLSCRSRRDPAAVGRDNSRASPVHPACSGPFR